MVCTSVWKWVLPLLWQWQWQWQWTNLFCGWGSCREKLLNWVLLLSLEALNNHHQRLQRGFSSLMVFVLFIHWFGSVLKTQHLEYKWFTELEKTIYSLHLYNVGWSQYKSNWLEQHYHWHIWKSENTWKMRKDLAGRVQSINQSGRDRFIPISPRNAPHLCHNTDTGNQSIRRSRGRIYNLVYKAYSAFLHTVQIGGFRPASQHLFPILSCNQLWRKFVFVGAHIELFWMNLRHHYCRKIH